MTFHAIINYGSALQAYAMQEGIAKCGVKTEIIDYQPQGDASSKARLQKNWKKLFSIKKWKQYLTRRFITERKFYADPKRAARRAERFYAFQAENFRLSERITDNDNLACIQDRYDALVCGSDQIWNPTYVGHDLSYFLDFAGDDAKRIAYAPSIAVMELPAEYKNEMREQLDKFAQISVREAQSVSVVQKLTGRQAAVVVDPTLLLRWEDWQAIEKAPDIAYTKEPYIFCYFLGPNPEYRTFVDQLKQLTGRRIVNVSCVELKVFRDYGDVTCDDIGPSEFVYLIHHADYVCTDSFHGTVFSMIYERNFFTFKRYRDDRSASENSRIYTLLDMAGCPERLVGSREELERLYRTPPDHARIRDRIESRRRASVDYLQAELARVQNHIGGKSI